MPRPVAGLPVLDAREIAKAWLLELMAEAPLEEAAALPAGAVAKEGPGVVAAVLAALGSDDALARLAPGGELEDLASRAGRLAGGGPAGAVRAAEALRRATGTSLRAAARLDDQTSAELTDRLAHVCALLAAAGVEEVPVAPVLEPAGAEIHALRRTPEPVAEEPASSRAAIERHLERQPVNGRAFAVLAVEVDGVGRLLAAQEAGEVDAGLAALERALGAELRPADQFLREEAGRYWVTAPDTGRSVARLLADRLADAAASAASHRGVPLAISIGIAVCPDDGPDADALVQKADQAMFAARAAGTPVA